MSGVFGDSDLDTTADEKDTVGATPTKGGVDKDEWKVFITSTINKYPLAAVILTLYKADSDLDMDDLVGSPSSPPKGMKLSYETTPKAGLCTNESNKRLQLIIDFTLPEKQKNETTSDVSEKKTDSTPSPSQSKKRKVDSMYLFAG